MLTALVWSMQIEIDYKSECMAGQTVESLGSRIQEETNGTGCLRYVFPTRPLVTVLQECG